MKNKFFQKALIALFLSGGSFGAAANEVYVSATGNDNNDGFSAAAPVATVGKALSLLDDGGTIHVSGWIITCIDDANPLSDGDANRSGFPIAKTVNIVGSNRATDGFVGTWLDLINFNSATGRFFTVNNNGVLNLKNLTLKDGVGSNRSGGVFVNGGTLTAEDVVFDHCESATTGADPARGGAIEVEKTLGVSFKRCLFINNVAPKGGVFYIQDTQNPDVELRFEACSFIGNKSTQGGASGSVLFFRHPSENLKINILNSTFSGNVNASTGGVIYIYGPKESNVYNIVNCTIVDNIGQSNGSGSSAGIMVQDKTSEADKPVINILNSIVEGNAINSGGTAEDLVFLYSPTADKLTISHSFIGNVFVKDANIQGEIPADCYTGTLYWNYMTRTPFNRAEILSGIDALNVDYNVYPLTAGSAALTYGDASFLQALGISTDQLGRTRSFADGKCSVGAMEGVGMPVGIPAVAAASNRVGVYREGDQFVLTSEQPVSRVELIDLGGRVVARASGNAVSVPAGKPGVYIARITAGGRLYSQKVMVP
ncbi:MAG: T9SS type A sorting domain-containing protein [Dysgonamonadaceae bacterium]|jgi:hypothetical protein|nr:T9SS type A sorting domain-containing protein [Dysgonamonadaceae bacterium]